MITPEDVKLQLMLELPKYTDEYGTVIEGSAVVQGGVIRVTAVTHGLTTDDVIIATNVNVIIPISDVSYDVPTGVATLTTAFEHDRTSGLKDNGGFNKAVLQEFADSTYNGSDFTIETGTRTTMILSAASSPDAAPVGELGEMVEPRSRLLGGREVTVIDVNTFTVTLENENIPDGETFQEYKFVTEQRIIIAADIERAVHLYNRRRDNEPTLFIIFGSEDASKDRNIVNDAIAAATPQNPLHITYLSTVTLMTISITKKDFDVDTKEWEPSTKQQQVYSEIRPALRQAMYGHMFDVPDIIIQFAAVEISNTPVRFNDGYYIHNFVYQIPYRISIEQGDVTRTTVSFRDLIVNSKMFDTEGALVALSTELEI